MQRHLAADSDFADWYVNSFMAQNLPTQYYSVSDQGKHEMVINGRKWARYCNFQDGEAQAHFITLMWKIGADFFCRPGFAEIAKRSAQDEMARIDAFYAVPRELAADAIMSPDDRYWYPLENGIKTGAKDE